ncbi:hypothetical protein V1511DRAFT_500821 [Dipodascopsis uninucleata]
MAAGRALTNLYHPSVLLLRQPRASWFRRITISSSHLENSIIQNYIGTKAYSTKNHSPTARELQDASIDPASLVNENHKRIYHIARTPSGSLPIYVETRPNILHKVIVIKNITGNIKACVEDLKTALLLKEDDISINPVTKHVNIRARKFTFTRIKQAIGSVF